MARGVKYATEEERVEARRAQWRAHTKKKYAEKNPPGTRREYVRGRSEEEKRQRQADYDAARYAQRTEKDREASRARDRARYDRLRSNPHFRARERQRSKAVYRQNPDYYLAKGSESARRKARTFGTLSPEHKAEVVAFYREARRLTLETGVPHEVDHIEPLRGKRSCGLHVPWNLRVITQAANRKKGNKYGEP